MYNIITLAQIKSVKSVLFFDLFYTILCFLRFKGYLLYLLLYLLFSPARGRVGRVTDCGVRDLGFKSPGSILTSRTEISSLSRVVRDGWDLCSVPLSGENKVSWTGVFDLAVEQPQLFR